MSVSNGQIANATTFNNAFASKSADNTFAGIQDLANAAAASGTTVVNAQREHNGVASFTGRTLNGAKDQLPTWSDNSVGLSTDNLKDRAEALTTYAKALSDNKVTGPASATDNAVVRFDSTTGKLIQDSGVIIDDTNNVTGVVDLTTTGNVIVGGDLTVQGTTTTINTVNLDVEDPNITVNNGGNQATADDVAGLTVEMSDADDAQLIYDKDVASKWKAGTDVTKHEILTTNHAQVVTLKDIDGGTATNTSRFTLPKETTTNLNALTRKQGTLLYDTTLNKVKYDDGSTLFEIGSGSGGSGGINYMDANPGAETDTAGYVTYADAAAASPVDGTGGAPTVTWTRSTSSPLRDTASFLFTKDAANRQGEGVSFDITIDSADKAKILQSLFEYSVVSGTFVDDDISIWIYDITNAALIQPAPYKLKNHTTAAERFPSEFQTSSSSTSYRFIIHVASTSASAYVLKFDNFSLGPQAKLYGSSITDFNITTQAPSGAITNATRDSYAWRRVGDSAQIQGGWTFTGAGSLSGLTQAQVLPSGLALDTTKIAAFAGGAAADYACVGTYEGYDAGVLAYRGVINYDKTNNTFNLWSAVAGAPYFTPGSGDALSITMQVPILGWGSSAIMSSDADTRVISARVYKNGTQAFSAETKVTSWTVVKDSHGMWDSSNNRFNILVPGDYEVSQNIYVTPTTSASQVPAYRVNGGGSVYFGTGSPSASGMDRFCGTALIPNLKAGDYVEIYHFTSAAVTVQASDSNTYVSIKKLSGPSQIMASELVEAHYSTAAGQTIESGGSGEVLNFGTVVTDSHGAVTTGASWKFTAPKAGTYSVKAFVKMADAAGWAVGEQGNLAVYKNGSIVEYLCQYLGDAARTNSTRLSGTTDIKLIAGDYIDIRIYQDNGASINLDITASINYVSIISR